ncbi:MAG: molybdate ABC transporter substrate-binding protein [Nitrospirae bacterium]|nr:molybdate ABC transporter substrate-binding protein [Nitrospirota bacterium]
MHGLERNTVKWFERFILLLLLGFFAVLFVEEASAGTELTVSAALSLKAPFEEIGRLYEKKSGVRVAYNFGPSGMLQKQIENSAPVDVFASASPKEMDSLEGSGFIMPATRSNFAGNAMVLITTSDAPRQLFSFADLRKREITRIAIGNPASVPAGKYSEETLRSLGLWDAVQPKLVYGEQVKQVMDYVSRREVDAGMVFLTDAMGRSKELRVAAEAPASSHRPVVYTIAVIRGTKNNMAARNFIAMVISKEGSDILRKYGFIVKP